MPKNKRPSGADSAPTPNNNQAAGDPVKVDDVNLKTIEIRLSAVKESTHRSRFIFIILTIVTSALLITLWNSTPSWESNMAYYPKHSLEDKKVQEVLAKGDFDGPAVKRVLENRDSFLSEWIKNLVVSVGLLGIRVSSTDFAVIGSAGLIVVMTWYFYSQRRENRAIVSLLRDCVEGYKHTRLNMDVCYMVFQGIVHSIVFIDLGTGDKPLSGLGLRKEKKEPGRLRRFLIKLISPPRKFFKALSSRLFKEKKNAESTFLVRRVVQALVYLPPITILLIIASDVWSLCCQRSPLRLEKGALWYALAPGEKRKVYAFELFALLSAFYTGYLCYLSTRFSKATADTLKEYEYFLGRPQQFFKELDAASRDSKPTVGGKTQPGKLAGG